jgi:hypothetical protein
MLDADSFPLRDPSHGELAGRTKLAQHAASAGFAGRGLHPNCVTLRSCWACINVCGPAQPSQYMLSASGPMIVPPIFGQSNSAVTNSIHIQLGLSWCRGYMRLCEFV